MAVHQGQYYSQFYVNLDHTQHLVTHGRELCEFEDGFLCAQTHFGRRGHTISHIFRLSYGQYQVQWRTF